MSKKYVRRHAMRKRAYGNEVADRIAKIIKRDWNEDDIVGAWNDAAEWNRYEQIYPSSSCLDEFLDMEFEGGDMSPSEIAHEVKRMDLDGSWCYFDDVYGLTTTDDIYDVVDVDVIADYCYDRNEDFGDDDIRAILDEVYGDEEDEEDE